MLIKKDFIIFFLFIILGSAGCLRKVTCPAFQSQYLIDEKAADEKFSLFKTDSTPKYKGYVHKNRNGIIVQKSYVRKTIEMKNIPMVKIYPEVTDSITMVRPADTTRRDTAAAQKFHQTKYMTLVNNDQLVYNALYGSLLIKKEKPEENLSGELKINKDSVQVQSEDTVSRKIKFRLFRKKQEGPNPESNKDQNSPKQNPSKPGDTKVKDDGF